MARKPRIHYPSACYHVFLRGNAGQDVFFSDSDRSRFCFLLQEGVERYRHRILAYCLMTNHIHLIIQVAEIPLSRIIQNLSFRYIRSINYQRKQFGYLFQGRYKAILIDIDNYLLELVRYLHTNPVCAGMVDTPERYTWSSPPLISRQSGFAGYQLLLCYLSLQLLNKRPLFYIVILIRQRKLTEARAVAALIVREVPHLRLVDLSKRLARDLSGLSQAAGRLENRLRDDLQLPNMIDKI